MRAGVSVLETNITGKSNRGNISAALQCLKFLSIVLPVKRRSGCPSRRLTDSVCLSVSAALLGSSRRQVRQMYLNNLQKYLAIVLGGLS